MSALTTKRTARVVLKIATNIQGKNPVGTTAANTNPITIAGVDGDNKIKGLVLNNDGAATVVVTSNSDIMGAVLNHGDIPNIVKNTPLLANATFTQDTIDRQEQVIPIGSTRIWVNADQSGTLYLEESHNGTNWTTTATNVVSAGVQVIRDWTVLTRRYVRIRYVNGATAQGSFKIQQYFIGVGVTPVRAEDGTIVSIGSKADAAVTDPSLSGSEIALLKGLLTKLNTIIDGTTPATTVLTGSYVAETLLSASFSVSAGSTTALPVQDISSSEFYVVGVIANSIHTYSVTGQRRAVDGNTLFDDGTSVRDQLAASASRVRIMSAEFRCRAPKVAIYISNTDAVDHTYSVYLYYLNKRG